MSVYDKEEVKIYDATTTDIDINGKAILTVYISENTGMCQIPLKENVENETTRTLVVNRPNILHAILNVYELPSTEKFIRYLHVAAGFPEKETWIKSIQAGNIFSWPGLTVRSVRQHFSKSGKTQQGHMKKLGKGCK